MRRYRTCSAEETASFGEALGGVLRGGDQVLLSGDLGMGKSVLARGIARAWGVSGPMPSPTFTLLALYDTARGTLCHYDLYRLEDPEEFFQAGLDEYWFGGTLCLTEWPMPELDFPEPVLRIGMARGESFDSREIELETAGLAPQREEEIRRALEKWEAER